MPTEAASPETSSTTNQGDSFAAEMDAILGTGDSEFTELKENDDVEQADRESDGTEHSDPAGGQAPEREGSGSGQDGRGNGQELEARFSSLEQSLSKVVQTLESLAAVRGTAQEPPALTPQPQAAPIEPPSFVTNEEFEDILSSPETLNKKLQAVYEKARLDSRAELQGLLEAAAAETQEATMDEKRKASIKAFYAANDEIRTKYVEPFLLRLQQVEAQHPGWEPDQMLAEAKKRLEADRALFSGTAPSATPSGGGTPAKPQAGLAPTPSGGRNGNGHPAQKRPSTTFADEIEATIGRPKPGSMI